MTELSHFCTQLSTHHVSRRQSFFCSVLVVSETILCMVLCPLYNFSYFATHVNIILFVVRLEFLITVYLIGAKCFTKIHYFKSSQSQIAIFYCSRFTAAIRGIVLNKQNNFHDRTFSFLYTNIITVQCQLITSAAFSLSGSLLQRLVACETKCTNGVVSFI